MCPTWEFGDPHVLELITCGSQEGILGRSAVKKSPFGPKGAQGSVFDSLKVDFNPSVIGR